jgi:putative peptidoglycan lipid II flippase
LPFPPFVGARSGHEATRSIWRGPAARSISLAGSIDEPLQGGVVLYRSLASVAYLAPDYDEAIAFFCATLGFELLEDNDLGGGKRWVVVAPGRARGAHLVIAKAADDRQRAAIGEAAGGRVAFFLETDDFARDHARFVAAGVKFLEAPRREPYGTVAVFVDAFGVKWDLLERTGPAS